MAISLFDNFTSARYSQHTTEMAFLPFIPLLLLAKLRDI